MTYPDPQNSAGSARQPDPVVTLSGERLRVATQWVESGRVRVRRQVTSETRTVEVTVRREELLVETQAAAVTDAAPGGAPSDGEPAPGPHPGHEPLVFVLSEEVPEVTMRTRAYQQVSVHVDVVSTEQTVQAELHRQAADLAIAPVGEDLPDRGSPSEG